MAFTEYAAATGEVRKTWNEMAQAWTTSFQTLLDQIPTRGVGPFDPRRTVEQFVQLTERVLEANRDYVKLLAGASLSVRQAVLDYSESVSQVYRDQASATMESFRARVDQVDHEVRAQARRAESQLAGRQEQTVKDKYADLTKAELAEKLAERSLPRTGTLEELRERLIESELQVA